MLLECAIPLRSCSPLHCPPSPRSYSSSPPPRHPSRRCGERPASRCVIGAGAGGGRVGRTSSATYDSWVPRPTHALSSSTLQQAPLPSMRPYTPPTRRRDTLDVLLLPVVPILTSSSAPSCSVSPRVFLRGRERQRTSDIQSPTYARCPSRGGCRRF
jgi:hypothetical protein